MSTFYYACLKCNYSGSVYYSAGPDPQFWICKDCGQHINQEDLFLEETSDQLTERLKRIGRK